MRTAPHRSFFSDCFRFTCTLVEPTGFQSPSLLNAGSDSRSSRTCAQDVPINTSSRPEFHFQSHFSLVLERFIFEGFSGIH
jgi:hypothetical protein